MPGCIGGFDWEDYRVDMRTVGLGTPPAVSYYYYVTKVHQEEDDGKKYLRDLVTKIKSFEYQSLMLDLQPAVPVKLLNRRNLLFKIKQSCLYV